MRTIDPVESFQENKEYELVPGDGENWDIRILEGDFTETMIRFQELRVADDGEHLTFNFDIVSTPDPDLTDENLELQKYVGNVLYSILENATVRESKKE